MDYGHENAWKYVRTEIRAHGHTTIHNRLTKEIENSVYRIVGGLYRNELDSRVKGSGIVSRY